MTDAPMVGAGVRAAVRWATRSLRSSTAWLVAVGGVLVIVGLFGIGLATNVLWGPAGDIEAAQRTLAEQFDRGAGETGARSDPLGSDPGVRPRRSPPAPGVPVARMEIPRIGERWMVVEGVQPRYIERAPGHYPDSAMPGELGNFAVAGHRAKGIFWDLDRLRRDDPIVVQTSSRWYVYRVTATRVVKPSAVEVVAPVPGRPGDLPTKARLTLTTCEPKWGNSRRLVVHADLVRSQPRALGAPVELRG